MVDSRVHDIFTTHVRCNWIEISKANLKCAQIKIIIRGCESMSHNAKTCKAIEHRVQVRFKCNDVGFLYAIMNQIDC